MVQDGYTALHSASNSNHLEAMELLIRHGADVHIKDIVSYPYCYIDDDDDDDDESKLFLL
jgi:ankyrin repeat protein